MLSLDTFQVQPTSTLREPLTLRWYYNSDFLDVNDESVKGASTNFYIEFQCSISAGIITIETEDVFTTLDANVQFPQSINCSAWFYRGNTQKTNLFTQWVVPSEAEYPGGVITFAQLTIYNNGANTLANPPTIYLTEAQTIAYFNTLSPAPNASALIKGITKLSVAPVSAINPIAVGDNDPRLISFIVGPASSTDNAVARWDSTTGKLLQNSVTTISDTGNIVSPGTLMTFGDTATAASGRINLTTHPTNTATTGRLFNWWTQTFAQVNGPGGEVNYDDDEQSRSYNQSASGTKTVAGIVDFGFTEEARFYTGSAFQTEHYFNWRSPNGLILIRPAGFQINHTNGAVAHNLQGDIILQRNVANGSTQSGQITGDTGSIDLTYRPAASLSFANNNSTGGLVFLNQAGSLGISLAYVDTSDQIQLVPGGQTLFIGSPSTTLGTSGGGASTLIVEKLQARSESDTYINMPGLNIIRFTANASDKARFDADGLTMLDGLLFSPDNTLDFGKLGGSINLRPRDAFIGRNLEVGTDINGVIGSVAPKAGSFTTVAASSSIKSSGTAGVGYATGAGGTVTQSTNKSTGVTLDKTTGTITMNNAALNAGVSVAFTLTNSTIADTDVVVINIKSGATANSYTVSVDAVSAGSCSISLRNYTGGNLSEAVVLSFCVIKGVAA